MFLESGVLKFSHITQLLNFPIAILINLFTS